MTHLPRVFLALALVASLSISFARAQASTADVISNWGLVGTWSENCDQPPSRINMDYSYVIQAGGHVSQQRDFGDGRDANDVLHAAVLPDRSLELTVRFQNLTPPQTRKWVLAKGSDGRIRSIANSKVDGTDQSIRDGKSTTNGKNTRWLARCTR
jgi:hypothetical protein